MRHRKAGRKLGRSASHRKAMFRNMVTSLIEEGMIQTTTPRAKEVRRFVEKLITSAKRNAPSLVDGAVSDAEREVLVQQRVAAIRQAGKFVRSRDALQILFSEYAERYKSRNGGYTRIVKVGRRLGDNADMALIELLPKDYVDARVRRAQSVEAAPAVEAEPVVEAQAEEEKGE
ncbi:50S ribosomal protein L17 [Myxococcota bacterium]|nr:50S ribosomal protein L17 [Myxococcota bacterium]MBU1430947.1 50S ribosomal protein L17 [Myxococcota bacterium]MBU1897258.1 50S ribosomal protein L17 [Myxococcota bacterium]